MLLTSNNMSKFVHLLALDVKIIALQYLTCMYIGKVSQ